MFAKHTITERREGDQDRKIAEKILAIDQSLESTTATAVRGKLEKSRTQLERIAKRRAQLPGRDAVISAQLMAMGETFEELYHQVSADPTGAGISDFLTEATDRLSIEEELSFSVADELENGPDDFTKKRMAVVAATKPHGCGRHARARAYTYTSIHMYTTTTNNHHHHNTSHHSGGGGSGGTML